MLLSLLFRNLLGESQPDRDFLGSPVVESLLPMQGLGLIPGQATKIPHALGQLSPSTITTESVPRAQEPELLNPHAATSESETYFDICVQVWTIFFCRLFPGLSDIRCDQQGAPFPSTRTTAHYFLGQGSRREISTAQGGTDGSDQHQH